MKITNIDIQLVENKKRMKAYATITLDNCLVIHNLRLIEGSQRLFVGMPSFQKSDGTFRNIVHPIDNETRNSIETLVIAAYESKKTAKINIIKTNGGMDS